MRRSGWMGALLATASIGIGACGGDGDGFEMGPQGASTGVSHAVGLNAPPSFYVG